MSESKPPKLPSAVVDTNLLISAVINSRGTPGLLIESWQRGAFLLVTSREQYAEVAEVITRPKIAERYHITAVRQRALLRRLERNSIKVTPRRRLPVSVRDPKDEKILATALGGKVDFLVTGDEDLLSLAHHPRIGSLQIVTASMFLDAIREER